MASCRGPAPRAHFPSSLQMQPAGIRIWCGDPRPYSQRSPPFRLQEEMLCLPSRLHPGQMGSFVMQRKSQAGCLGAVSVRFHTAIRNCRRLGNL